MRCKNTFCTNSFVSISFADQLWYFGPGCVNQEVCEDAVTAVPERQASNNDSDEEDVPLSQLQVCKKIKATDQGEMEFMSLETFWLPSPSLLFNILCTQLCLRFILYR